MRDNGRNITKALEDANFNGASCTAHNQNLVVQKGNLILLYFSSYQDKLYYLFFIIYVNN